MKWDAWSDMRLLSGDWIISGTEAIIPVIHQSELKDGARGICLAEPPEAAPARKLISASGPLAVLVES